MFESADTYRPLDYVTAENRLWLRYFEGRPHEARNRLVLFYAPLVRFTARRIAARGVCAGIDDLCQMGMVGLIDAVERFDPSDGYKFSTYATSRIRGAIFDGLRELDMLPKRARVEVRDYFTAREEEETALHRPPTFDEVASRLGKPTSQVVQTGIYAAHASAVTSLSLLDSESQPELVDWVADPDETVELRWVAKSVQDGLKSLTERQRQALVLHYLEGFTKSEVAEVLGVDRSRVTQLIHQGLRNLKVELGWRSLYTGSADSLHCK